jgi:hypothetical protein
LDEKSLLGFKSLSIFLLICLRAIGIEISLPFFATQILAKQYLTRRVGAMEAKRWDDGDRRSGMDRRQFSYSGHMPERRTGEERRRGTDRRQGPRLGPEHRAGTA